MPAPIRLVSEESSPHFALFRGVREALLTLPLYFRTQTVIEGISAVDIFTLNAAFGATIENQVVATLNQMRTIWDPDGVYRQYLFVRQSQTFPDVLLRGVTESEQTVITLLGIELKGWYLVAKEGEPSFRFTATPAACAPADLIVVVPWALTNVIAGSPIVFTPYIESSRYAAEYRNYHWQELRKTTQDVNILLAPNVHPYPRKSDAISDKPKTDAGGNFGRFARTGLMDDYISQAKQELLAGIRAEHWLAFFKLFQDQREHSQIPAQIEKLRTQIRTSLSSENPKAEAALALLSNLERLLSSE